MKLSIIKNINGNTSIDSEWDNNENGAKVKYHQVCANLLNSQDVTRANVRIADETLDVWSGYSEEITHEVPEE